MDDEYAKLIRRMNPPRVVIDNNSCKDSTVIQVDSVNKHGILLDFVQVLIDLDLVITKAYISSDGGWFMDVFHVTDRKGDKLRDGKIIHYIEKSLVNDVGSSVGVTPSKEYTSIELTGADRPGLLSELFAVLTSLGCNVMNGEIWTHNTRAAAVIHVVDESTGSIIKDPEKLSKVKEFLCNVLRGNDDLKTAKMMVSVEETHRERRLHQMMFADRDYEKVRIEKDEGNKNTRTNVTLVDCLEKDYTVVILRSKDRMKLLFDTVCTLTDLGYVVFHGKVETGSMGAYQEYYIRHIDGSPISSEAERQRVALCLEAAIERRSSEGLELQLCTEDRVGLLSWITRIFRENSLCIKRAEISTRDGKAIDTFYVEDLTGNPVEAITIDSIRRQIGHSILHVKQNPDISSKSPDVNSAGFLLGSLFKACSFQNFRLIRSYS